MRGEAPSDRTHRTLGTSTGASKPYLIPLIPCFLASFPDQFVHQSCDYMRKLLLPRTSRTSLTIFSRVSRSICRRSISAVSRIGSLEVAIKRDAMG